VDFVHGVTVGEDFLDVLFVVVEFIAYSGIGQRAVGA